MSYVKDQFETRHFICLADCHAPCRNHRGPSAINVNYCLLLMAHIIIDGLTNDESQFFDITVNYGHHIGLRLLSLLRSIRRIYSIWWVNINVQLLLFIKGNPYKKICFTEKKYFSEFAFIASFSVILFSTFVYSYCMSLIVIKKSKKHKKVIYIKRHIYIYI